MPTLSANGQLSPMGMPTAALCARATQSFRACLPCAAFLALTPMHPQDARSPYGSPSPSFANQSDCACAHTSTALLSRIALCVLHGDLQVRSQTLQIPSVRPVEVLVAAD